jgi:hypothetical protein
MKPQMSWRVYILFVTLQLLTIALVSPCVAISSHIQLVDAAPPSPTSISCSVLPASVILGNSSTVSGSITPVVSDITITLTYTKPDATTINRTATTGTDGSFTDTFIPDVVGSWSVNANWAGNDNYFGSSSFDESFTVEKAATAGFPMIYVYLIVIIIVVIVAVIAAYSFMKRKTKPQ